MQKSLNTGMKKVKIDFIISKKEEIVHVSQVTFDFQSILYKVIKPVKIQVGKMLTCQASNWYAFAWLFGLCTVNDGIHKPNQVWILECGGKDLLQ